MTAVAAKQFQLAAGGWRDSSQSRFPCSFRFVKADTLEREAIYWEHEGNRAVRVGDWKLVAKGKEVDRSKPVEWERYNIVSDCNENVNLK